MFGYFAGRLGEFQRIQLCRDHSDDFAAVSSSGPPLLPVERRGDLQIAGIVQDALSELTIPVVTVKSESAGVKWIADRNDGVAGRIGLSRMVATSLNELGACSRARSLVSSLDTRRSFVGASPLRLPWISPTQPSTTC